MPVEARGNKIIEKKTGRVVGTSKSAEMAKRAARTRNAIVYGGFKPTREKRKGPARTRTGAY